MSESGASPESLIDEWDKENLDIELDVACTEATSEKGQEVLGWQSYGSCAPASVPMADFSHQL